MAENTATAAAQGTTLAILQHYLDAGIEVEIRPQFMPVGRGTLVGLRLHPRQHRWLADVRYAAGQVNWPWPVSDLLPVLRPFAALCEPLADGTTAFYKTRPCTPQLKALLEFAYGAEVDVVHYTFAEPANCTNSLNRIYVSFSVDDERLDSCFWSDGTALVANISTQCLDYLRANHYALPINGRPLVEGIDYIAKPAAGAPTIEKGEAS